jgi:hypothetical protein
MPVLLLMLQVVERRMHYKMKTRSKQCWMEHLSPRTTTAVSEEGPVQNPHHLQQMTQPAQPQQLLVQMVVVLIPKLMKLTMQSKVEPKVQKKVLLVPKMKVPAEGCASTVS